MIVVSFGGGTNSTALLVGMAEKSARPDLIIFADTGGEKPHTYRHIDDMQIWLRSVGFPLITIVRKVNAAGDVYTLEQDCIDHKKLPSLAYGFKQCSQKYKIQPQDKFLNNHQGCISLWASGGKVTKLIGYDIGESHRIKDYDCPKYDVRYPLVDWGWDRDDCIAAIKRAGIPQPGKSACFFCPASRAAEIREMAALYPDLADRAVRMEKNAELTSVKGLGRNFAWADLIATDDMFSESYIELSCGCYDG